VQQVLQTLLAARLVVEVSRGEPAYVPARPLEDINAHHVLMAMRATMGQELVTRDEPVRAEVYGEFARIQSAEKAAAESVTMFALVSRAQARLELPPSAGPERKIALTTLPSIQLSQEEPDTRTLAGLEPVEATSKVQCERDKETGLAANIRPPESAALSSGSPNAPRATSATDDNESFPL
jgi:hypothetical protein